MEAVFYFNPYLDYYLFSERKTNYTASHGLSGFFSGSTTCSLSCTINKKQQPHQPQPGRADNKR